MKNNDLVLQNKNLNIIHILSLKDCFLVLHMDILYNNNSFPYSYYIAMQKNYIEI